MSMMSLIFLVLAASSNNSGYTPTFPAGGLIAWLICNSTKRQQIGGFLMLYYWQLYSGALMTIIFLGLGFQSYVPESFDEPRRYYLFLISVVPTLLVLALEIAVATMMVSVRTWDMLKLLRWLMVAGLVFAGVGTIVDIDYFPDNLPFDALTIIPSTFWLLYFFLSRRVKHVFKLHDWDTVVATWYPPKTAPQNPN